MTIKIPIGETVNAAYGFTFGSFTSIIKLIWLPMLLVVGLDYLQAQIAVGQELSGLNFVRYVAYLVGMLLLFSIMITAVTERALGLRENVPLVHIALGMPEFRVFGALLTYALLMAFLALLVSAGAFGANYAVSALAGGQAGQLAAATWQLAALGFFIYCSVRLSFLLWPSVVAEQRISLERSWVLTEGNFWRLFLVQIVLVLPLIFLWSFLISLLMGQEMAGLQQQFAGRLESPAYAEALGKLVEAHQAEMMLLMVFLMPFFIGFSVGASAHAYRLATGQRPPSDVPAEESDV